jgi:hypothetical protein
MFKVNHFANRFRQRFCPVHFLLAVTVVAFKILLQYTVKVRSSSSSFLYCSSTVCSHHATGAKRRVFVALFIPHYWLYWSGGGILWCPFSSDDPSVDLSFYTILWHYDPIFDIMMTCPRICLTKNTVAICHQDMFPFSSSMVLKTACATYRPSINHSVVLYPFSNILFIILHSYAASKFRLRHRKTMQQQQTLETSKRARAVHWDLHFDWHLSFKLPR